MWDNQASFWVCCSICLQPSWQTHRLFHWSPFLWGCIAWLVRSCSHWLHVPKNGTVYKNRKKFPIPSLFPDVLQILFHCLPLSYVSSLLWAATLRWSSRLTGWHLFPKHVRGKLFVNREKQTAHSKAIDAINRENGYNRIRGSRSGLRKRVAIEDGIYLQTIYHQPGWCYCIEGEMNKDYSISFIISLSR